MTFTFTSLLESVHHVTMVVSKLISFTSFTCVAWRVIVHGIAKSWIQLSDQITKKKTRTMILSFFR